jgi:UDP-N-acetylglucosamine 2-epimerase (non-hydrolysing)
LITVNFPDVLHVIGARPNVPKAAPVVRALAEAGASQLVVSTGQHYDDDLFGSMLRAVGMSAPDIELNVGSGSHAQQTAAVLTSIEPVLIEQSPRIVVVYGDVNSTLAAALAAAKLHLPVAHVESGLRSHDPAMPEEINRRLVDHLSTLLFVTSPDAWVNLRAEGLANERAIEVGNPMIDSLIWARDLTDLHQRRIALDLPEDFILATIHRPSNVDDPDQVEAVLGLLRELGSLLPVVLPVHPRSRVALSPAQNFPGVQLTAPLEYRDFLAALAGSRVVVTDSGGVQEESSFLGIPCVTIRTTTERPVTITHGTNQLATLASATADVDAILRSPRPAPASIPLWDGHAGNRIAAALLAYLHRTHESAHV